MSSSGLPLQRHHKGSRAGLGFADATPANFARLDFILTQDDLVALPKVLNGLLEAREAAVRMLEIDDSDDEVEEVGSLP